MGCGSSSAKPPSGEQPVFNKSGKTKEQMDADVEAAAAPTSVLKLDRNSLLEKVFKACDADGNGYIDLGEYRAVSDEPEDFIEDLFFTMLDEDGDSKLSRDEVRGGPPTGSHPSPDCEPDRHLVHIVQFLKANLDTCGAMSDPEFQKQIDRWLQLASSARQDALAASQAERHTKIKDQHKTGGSRRATSHEQADKKLRQLRSADATGG